MTRGCPICGGPGVPKMAENIDRDALGSFAFASRKRPELMWHKLHECTDCRALFAPEPADLGDLLANYSSADFDASTESRFAAATYAAQVRRLAPGFRGRVLDVGCGDGTFIALFGGQTGADCRGVEPSLAAVEQATPDVKGRIFVGGFHEFRSAERFDLIVLFQTIEHLEDPDGFFSLAKEWLVDGGRIVICCHDYRSGVNRVLRTKSPIYDIEHLQILSSSSAKKLLEKQGFSDVTVRPYWNRYPLKYWFRLAPLPEWVKTRVEGSHSRLLGKSLAFPLGNLVCSGVKR